MSVSAPIAPGAVSSGGAESSPALAAAERVQQLRAMIALAEGARSPASVESPTATTPTTSASATTSATAVPSTSFADALSSAQTAAQPGLPAGPGTEAPGAGGTYLPLINQAAARNGVSPALLYGLIEQESGFNPSARSGAGAEGLTQLMPSTAASLGVANPLDPAEAIEGGARYLAQLLQQFAGNTPDALAAYNAGPGAVQQYGGVPPYAETQQYVSKVLGYAASYPEGETSGVAA